MITDDIIKYRLDDHEKQISTLRENGHDIKNSFIVLDENLKLVYKSLNETFDKLTKLCEKVTRLDVVQETLQHDHEIKCIEIEKSIKELEKDKVEYKARKKAIRDILGWLKSYFYYIPIAIIGCGLIVTGNYQKLFSMFIRSIHS